MQKKSFDKFGLLVTLTNMDELQNQVICRVGGKTVYRHLYELVGVGVQLGQHGRRLVGRAVLQDALDDAAAVWVRRQRVHLPGERVDDELQSARLHALDALLHLHDKTVSSTQYPPTTARSDLQYFSFRFRN